MARIARWCKKTVGSDPDEGKTGRYSGKCEVMRLSGSKCVKPRASMNKVRLVLSCFLFLGSPAFARESTDVIVMENGDRLTGEIKGLDAGVLYVSLNYADGTISLSWSKVARIKSSQLFIVTMGDGSVYAGKLGTRETSEGRLAKLEIAQTAATNVELDPGQVVGIAGTSESIWQRFNGAMSLGIIYAKANTSTQYNLSSDIEYLRERWSAQGTVNSTLSANRGAATATHNQVNLSAVRLLPWKNYFYAGLADFLQNSDQGINFQTSLGAGVGRYLKNTHRFSLSIIGGAAWQSTNYQAASAGMAESPMSVNHQDLVAGLVASRLKLFEFKKTNLQVTATLFPAITEAGRIRFNTNASYYVKFFGNLAWNMSFYGNWDNRPPNRLSTSDYGTSSGISWTFGLK